jgi:hypothetical protein
MLAAQQGPRRPGKYPLGEQKRDGLVLQSYFAADGLACGAGGLAFDGAFTQPI